jgi:glutaconate CoA-transferase subunit B
VLSDCYLYVPRHTRVTFVEKLDYLSGIGHNPKRRWGAGPRYLVTDLGQFDFKNGRMRLTHVHPGVTVARVQAKTGFELEISDTLTETEPPTARELHLLREEIDPYKIRRLELLSGPKRRAALREALREEIAHSQNP